MGRECGRKISFDLLGRREFGGHTWYIVQCTLTEGEAILDWNAPRRLCMLRGGLHDPIVTLFGASMYDKLFQAHPFARHGSLPGTSSRISLWLRLLGDLINDGTANPVIAAYVLYHFQPPGVCAEDYMKFDSAAI